MADKDAAQAHAAPHEGARAVRRGKVVAWIAAAITLSLGILPFFYAAVAEGLGFALNLSGSLATHVVINAAATCLVMLMALRVEGRLDRKVAAVLSRVLLVHGALAFILMVTRQFHSNKVMMTAAATSAVLGGLVMLVRHMNQQPRIALLGPWHDLAGRANAPIDWIEHPNQALATYDILLTSDVIELSPEWSGPLTHVMLTGRQVRHLAEFVEEEQGIVSIEHFDLGHLPSSGLTSYRVRKRIMDVGLTLAVLPVALPILAVGALVVLFTMGRPILFKQSRIGLGGKPFDIYKLRTMRAHAPGAEATASQGVVDLRITRSGKWLRRFRIDELPQLWNVLKGDMSIIGPRPEWTALGERYVEQLPAYAYRHLVRPGITGWAQVRGGYAADLSETRTKVGYDLFYIKNFSFSLDVQILVRTVWTLLSGFGAR